MVKSFKWSRKRLRPWLDVSRVTVDEMIATLVERGRQDDAVRKKGGRPRSRKKRAMPEVPNNVRPSARPYTEKFIRKMVSAEKRYGLSQSRMYGETPYTPSGHYHYPPLKVNY